MALLAAQAQESFLQPPAAAAPCRTGANALANYHFGDRWSASLGGRYSGTLVNSDTNAFSFTGTSSFVVFDARVRCRIGERWIASLGVDNLGNEEYWAFHPLHPAHHRRGADRRFQMRGGGGDHAVGYPEVF